MKTLRPLALSALHAPFERQGKVYLCAALATMTSFDGETLEDEQTLWQTLTKTPGFRGILDELRPKTKSEVLVLGSAFAPPGRVVNARSVRIEVGPIVKELWVVGDRTWKNGIPTEPTPFDQLPITWERAFGGEGHKQNPVGRGLLPIKTEEGVEVHHLPNVELPKKLITSLRDRPTPASFSPIDPSWQCRIDKLGTYDEKWLKTRAPDYPDDFDPSYFNMAPDDQSIDGYFSGGERIVVEHMHPEKERIEGEIPRLSARLFLSREGDLCRSIPMRCDTVWLVPHLERLVLIYRTFVEVKDDEASDVLDVMFALERSEAPKPLSHYQAVRAKRLDRDEGAIAALRDKDLVPEGMKRAKLGGSSDITTMIQREGLAERNAIAKAQTELDRARTLLRENGVDPDKHMPREIPQSTAAPDADNLGEFVEVVQAQAKSAREEAEKMRTARMDELRRTCKESGIDLDAVLAADKKNQGGPPKFTAKEELARAKQQFGLETFGDVDEKIDKAEEFAKQAYRKFAHDMPRASEAPEDTSARMRMEVLLRIEHGEPLTDRDYTGADFRGIDFSSQDLSRSFLECAKLDGCLFVGAKLEDTVLTRASLRGANFERANLRGCNLGEADLEGARMTGGIDATACVIARANLSGADFSRAKLDKADITGAKLDGADLSYIEAKELTVLRSDFRGAKLRGARLVDANLLEIDISGVDMREVSLKGTVFLDVNAEKANFDGADLENIRVVAVDAGCSLAGASFRGANLTSAFLRSAKLESADFTDAILGGADFSRADLRNARFDYARARDSRWMKADLTGASFVGTDLMQSLLGGVIVRGARFEKANLFRADAGHAVGDDKTSFRGANVHFVRMLPRQNG